MVSVQDSKSKLARRVTSLERQISDLRKSMAAAAAIPHAWKLTPKERDLFLALLSTDVVTRQMAILALYGVTDRPAHSVDVFMSRLRSKTESHSVQIETINRTGYRLVDRLVWAKTLKLDTVEH